MSKTRITLTVDPKGGVKIENVCGAGGKCQELTAGLEKRLGVADEATRKDTDDLYKPVELDQQIAAG